MPIELFIVPIIGTGTTKTDAIRPKYSDDPAVVRHGHIVFNKRDESLALFEAPQAYLNSIAGQSDATRVATASNIDNALNSNQANNMQAFLEARNIPAQWVQAGLTRREAVRTLAWIFMFTQRMVQLALKPAHQKLIQWVDNGNLTNIPGHENDDQLPIEQQYKAALNLTWAELPTAAKQYFQDIADNQNIDPADLDLNNASTVKEIFQMFGRVGFGIKKRLQRNGITLNTAYSAFPQVLKDELQDLIADWGVTAADLNLTASSSLREILKAFADLHQNTPVKIGGVLI